MSTEHSNALSLILYFVDNEYRKSHPHTSNIDHIHNNLEEVLQTAVENKLSYYFIKRVIEERPDLCSLEMKKLMEHDEKQLDVAKETLNFLNSLFHKAGIDFLVLKTHKNLPYSTLDIDIAVKDFRETAKTLEKGGALRTDGPFLNVLFKLDFGYPGYRVERLMNIDLYTDIPWSGLRSLDNEFLWRNPRMINVYDVNCPIPNTEADLLSLISTSLFTDRKLTLLDFLYMDLLLSGKLNFDRILRQTNKYGWSAQFFNAISILRNIKQLIYESKQIPKSIRFPYTLPMSLLLKSLPGPLTYVNVKNPKSFPSALAKVSFHCFLGHIYVGVIRVMNRFNVSRKSS